jgi:putative transposase
LSPRIPAGFLAGRGVDGSPRIHAARRAQGVRCSRKRVARRLCAQGLCAGRPRRRQPRTTNRQQTPPIAPHLLGRAFTAAAPNRQWVAAITGLHPRGGWRSRAGILEVYSRRASGDARDGSREERLVETALDMALLSRRPRAGLVHHSDRGSQDSSTGYRGILEGHGIRLSMSGRGEPDANALLERCFSTLKGECVARADCQTPDEARACIFEYLAVFYNRQRLHCLHAARGSRSPMAFEHLPVAT